MTWTNRAQVAISDAEIFAEDTISELVYEHGDVVAN